jgi:hypothetical protein
MAYTHFPSTCVLCVQPISCALLLAVGSRRYSARAGRTAFVSMSRSNKC